jgi:hypothetical protein
MNRRKFIQSSALAGISALVLPKKLQALNFHSGFNKHLLIDLGAVRFQDVIADKEQTAMPHLLQFISSGAMILDTSAHAKIVNHTLADLLENAMLFQIHTLNKSYEFYDIALIEASIESVITTPQNLLVRIHQTEMAHYNVEAYRSLLSQADELIHKNFMRLKQSGVQVHIYSSSGRNLQPDEYGGLHHHTGDINCTKTFYIQSAIAHHNS